MKPEKLLAKTLASPANVRFGNMQKLVDSYHINIFYSNEDGGYIADIPDLEACSAFGKTPAKALAELQIAKAAWLDVARQSGKPIPQPRYRPAIYQAAAG